MKKLFEQNPSAKVKRNAFDLSHERKLSTRMGELTPVLVQECVPGDKFSIDTQSMIRFAPLVAPVMHRINAHIHFFYVPNRILWDGWEKFVTGDATQIMPTQPLKGINKGGLGDHMGLPLCSSEDTGLDVNLLPFRAYVKIYNDYYRDENLLPELSLEDVAITDTLLNRSYEKDYFTSALPWAQKGNPVTMDANISYKPTIAHFPVSAGSYTDHDLLASNQTTGNSSDLTVNSIGLGNATIENIDSVSVSVEELRRATRLQRWLERNARSGTRYVEHLLAHWGVKSSDARLQRAEYIGGGKSPVVISEVLNTTGTTELPQGNMAGHGINVGLTNTAHKFCEEHGFIIGILSIMPESNYQQGLPKFLMRKLNLDYYYPEFAQLGEQEVLNGELYVSNVSELNQATFGYQSRFAEYKQNFSTVHGEFKDTLDYWHLGRKFANTPTLSGSFITCYPGDLTRIFAVESDTENLYVQLYHKITAIRPLPFFNDPRL